MPTIPLLALAVVFLVGGRAVGQYEPNWNSLDTRPLPEWYDKAKFGIFIHWGVFSVPSYDSEWFWYDWQGEQNAADVEFMQDNYPPDFTYPEFAPQFQVEFFDANHWAEVFAAAGAKYVVLTSKHHEGFTLWPSSVSWNWNAVDTGPKLDLVGALAAAIRNRSEDIHFGLYHSLFEWFHPVYLADKNNSFQSSVFPQYKTLPELHEIVNAYLPDVIWSDGDWEAPDTYWKSTDFLAWLYNESPVKDTVVTNDRWGSNVTCAHGDFYSCSDRYNPGTLQPHKWENCMTIDRYSWGYRRNAVYSDYLSIEDLISTLASTISCGGNLLMNIGPTKEGTIIPIFEERLRQMGQWLSVNGEAVYESVPWTYQNDTVTPNVWYTSKGVTAYAFLLNWPDNNVLFLGAPTAGDDTQVSLLGYEGSIGWTGGEGAAGISVTLPNLKPGQLPWAWVIKLENLSA